MRKNLRDFQNFKASQHKKKLSMLTCYDFQTAELLDQCELDMILVGDSLGNVILGYDTTVPVELRDMICFGSAVRRGAKNKFLVIDMPFGTYWNIEVATQNAIQIMQKTMADAIKIEGAGELIASIVTRLTQLGIPVVGHIGLTPQSVNQLGGYYIHGKTAIDQDRLMKEAKQLEEAGAFCIVLECIEETLSKEITQKLKIPTIGIGSGPSVDGHVMVINDLFHLGAGSVPKFCKPLANLFQLKKELLQTYLETSTQCE